MIKKSILGIQVYRILLMLIFFHGLCPLFSQNSSEVPTRIFTDSAGRRVCVPLSIDQVAPSGTMAQLFLLTLNPSRLAGLAARPGEKALQYLPEVFRSLPVFGQFYGSVSNLNLEALITAGPDLIIDMGELKPSLIADLNSLEKRTGLPVVFISAAGFSEYGNAYRMLGALLGEESGAEERARYCDRSYGLFKDTPLGVNDKAPRLYYGEGPTGLQTVGAGSLHSEVFELAGARNIATLSGGGSAGGNKISMEQLILWDPEFICFGYGAAKAITETDPLWNALDAVREGRVYTIPGEPFYWHGRPPSVNRLLGLYWLRSILYRNPEDLSALPGEIKTFFRLFYHRELKAEELEGFMEGIP